MIPTADRPTPMALAVHVTILFTTILSMPKDVSQSTPYAKHGIISGTVSHAIKDTYFL